MPLACVSKGNSGKEVTIGTQYVVTRTDIPYDVEITPVRPGPVTYRGASVTDIETLDPQAASDPTSIDYIEQLFVTLTNYEPETGEVVPEAAARWDISEDGLKYTFHLRTDIPWVYHNQETNETAQVMDDQGNPRFVKAQDFVNAIQRACSHDLASDYSTVIAPQIIGCEDTLLVEDAATLTADDYEAIGVYAADDATLVIELTFPASFFLSMTPMWTLAAIPQWAIDEHGSDTWFKAGFIVTNGAYVLSEWVPGGRRTLIRNPWLPLDMAGKGNIEVFQFDAVANATASYKLWLAGEVEESVLPNDQLQTHLDLYPGEVSLIFDPVVFYVAFAHDKPPFDDARVRAAFSAAFDRERYIRDVFQGRGLAMKHFAPAGIFGAPPIDEVGVGFDPEFAVDKLSEAGYPNCEDFPQITLVGYDGDSTLSWLNFARANWSENLGCSADILQIEQIPFDEFWAATDRDAPVEDRPHMWTLGWSANYPDENNWVGAVLWCEGDTRTNRPCTHIDDLIVLAREESDADVRVELYRQIEEGFFGENGEFPFAPLHLRIRYAARHAWLSYTVSHFGGAQWYNWRIDDGLRMEMSQ